MLVIDTADLTVHDQVDGSPDRHVARLPEAIRRRLGVLSGDTVTVTGDSTIALQVWPANSGLPADGIELDAYARRKTGVSVGDTVTVQPRRIEPATVAVVRLDGWRSEDDAVSAVRRTLRDRPIEVGDRVPVGEAIAAVLETDPDGPVKVTRDTRVSIRTTRGDGAESTAGAVRPRSTGVTYDDVGGLDSELALVRESIELPLAEPDLFDRLGIEAPSGVLLFGPPGTGKTLIVEAVATEIDATVYHVSGPEITSKYKGESEERLRAIFDRARETAPSLVFFDEMDAIAGKRDEQSDMENRVVAQLLSLLDGLEPREDVMVIGATNRVDTLDPALRRPGRFDREIEIGVPDRSGRRQILDIHVDGVPLAEDVDLDRLADRSHGFVGADLRALVTEAAMEALRRRHDGGDSDRLVVTGTDFERALASVDPSAMREFVAETPEATFADVGGLAEAKQVLREAVEWPIAQPGLFDAVGTEPPTGILLYGPPGTGKTLLARALAGESDVNFVHVAGPELIDKYVGESEKAVREVFERARQAAPSIVFFDEIDAIAGRRGGDGTVGERVVSQLLTELDGVAANPNLVVLAATNRKATLDPALLRPGRLEVHIEVPDPDRAERLAILRVHTRDTPLSDAVDLSALAEATQGLTGAEIEALVREASMRAIRAAVTEHGLARAGERADQIAVEPDHLEVALERIRQG